MSRLDQALADLKTHYPQLIELSLGRIETLLTKLGNPHHKLPPIIHVAGTNGKVSTCAFLRAMAEAAGLRVHVYTSPHLVRFNERIRIAGDLISDEALVDCLERVKAGLGDGQITQFEATTAAAFLAFSETPADLLILEVGLGGRFDATNIIPTAAVSVISPVDYDHKQFLGDKLEGIAGEKAGIIRPSVPVACAVQRPEAAGVIAGEAETRNAPLHVLQRADFEVIGEDLALLGAHQRANAALAAKALRLLDTLEIDADAVRAGAASASWPARMQKLSPGPLVSRAEPADVWLDGGHNPHAARAVAALLSDLLGETVLVCAMMASKDAEGFFAAFSDLSPRVHTCPNSDGHQGRAPEDLADAARRAGLEATGHSSFDAAFRAATDEKPAQILICGSLYLSGDVLEMNRTLPD
ncbi:MAG: folylpolyglutamate synthase/dihydrofolate synthase family protein [Pseudomonadota bacterium]